MPVVVKARGNRPETRVVPVDGLEGCTLTVREPTDRERYGQWVFARLAVPLVKGERDRVEWQASIYEYRLRVVSDWSGFNAEDGSPIPFSKDWLLAAMRAMPLVEEAALSAASNAFDGIDGAEEKNSDSPSVAG